MSNASYKVLQEMHLEKLSNKQKAGASSVYSKPLNILNYLPDRTLGQPTKDIMGQKSVRCACA